MLLLIAATTAVLLAALIFATLLPSRGSVAFVLAVALLAQAIVVSTVGFAGLVLRDLSPNVLLGLAAIWPVVGLLAARVYAARRPGIGERLRASLATLRSVLADPSVALAALLVVGALAWRAFLALRLPVIDYDGWSYHLVFVDVWLQNGALTLVPQRDWTAGYPADTELLTTWLAAFTRTDALTGFTSLIPIPLAIAATTGLARYLGADRRRALLAGLLLGMTPALVALAGTTYVDNESVAFVTATWWLGLRAVRGERGPSTVLLLGLAGGLAIGTKGTNLLLVTPILATAGILLARPVLARGRGWTAFRSGVGNLLLLGGPLLLLGGSWYAKNAILFGNPFYPFAIGPFPGPTTLTDFAFVPAQLEGKSWLDQLVASWTADWHLLRYDYNVRPGGLGRAWPAILALGVAGLVVIARRRQLAILGLVVLPAAVTLATMPMPWYARLTLFLPALVIPIAIMALEPLPARWSTMAGLALVAVAAVSLTFANVRPNFDIRAGLANPSRSPGPRQFIAFLLDPSDARRANVNLRAACAGFAVIPPGARVAPGGFNLLHGVVGPNLDRILTDPIARVSGSSALVEAMRERGASWLVTHNGGTVDAVAASAIQRLQGYGEICQGARLWKLAAGG